jgi:hypothetical protein
MTPPTHEELFAAAIPSSIGVDGVVTLPRLDHCLLLASHSWQHGPLPRLRDMIDIALMAKDIEATTLDARARQWSVGRVWSTTAQVIMSLFCGHRERPWPLRLWARHLPQVRERSALEARMARWFIGGMWAPSPGLAIDTIVSMIGRDIQPWPEEPWSVKLRRMSKSVRQAFEPASHANAPAAQPPNVGENQC